MKAILSLLFVLITTAGAAQDALSSIAKGNDYYRQSRYDMAEAQYRNALQTEPGNQTAQYNLANALEKQKKYDEAIKVLNGLYGITQNNPLRSPAYYNEGVAYTKLKNLEESIESYKNALRINPNDQEARENLQKALRELKKKQQQQQQQKQKPEPKMSQKEAEQKLKLLEQKERNLQQRMQNRNRQQGGGQAQDW